ncbi:VOC family protein [Planococcus shixiaomingii]|uniref:VOC family protein n=1 Tax=Planococcus shixiaomingii TaxID=3058393 RepID=UPI0026106363|nr:VOC family protein [Planococcus sp. N022]WKA53885.1 VOC family protein [Planococcus sp. N022]
MAEEQNLPRAGTILFTDLTVERAEETRDFYKQVIGWEHSDVKMGDYADYEMKSLDGQSVAGICHQAGVNKGLPPVWLVYFSVQDLEASLTACRRLGGIVHVEPKTVRPGSYAVIEYPEGAFCALSQL